MSRRILRTALVPSCTPVYRDDFLHGICVALQVLHGYDHGNAWRELAHTAGVDQLLDFAAYVEPDEWELAGFSKRAWKELRRHRPKTPLPDDKRSGQRGVRMIFGDGRTITEFFTGVLP